MDYLICTKSADVQSFFKQFLMRLIGANHVGTYDPSWAKTIAFHSLLHILDSIIADHKEGQGTRLIELSHIGEERGVNPVVLN